MSITSATSLSPSALAWRDWLQEFAPRLLLFARQQTRSYQDAEDVLQDALIKLTQKLESGDFVGGKEAWMPYLYATIRRLAIDLGRKDDRRQKRETHTVEDADALSTSITPWFESQGTHEDTQRQLEASLKELPPKFAEVLIMKIWGEQTFAEIGETLGISQNTAASRYRYGLEALQKKLQAARHRGDI